jgi:transcriptional regulator with XRE-family HTH domain
MKRVFMRFDALTPQAIGEAVRLRRKALGNTLDDLAEASGISKRTLIKLEQGQDVRFSTLTTVLSWLGLSLDFSAASKKVLEATEHDKLRDGRREEAADDAQWF